MDKTEGNGILILDVIWGFIVIGIASLFLRETVHAFFGMTHITFWDATAAIFLLYNTKLVLKEIK